MVGADPDVFAHLESIFKTLAPGREASDRPTVAPPPAPPRNLGYSTAARWFRPLRQDVHNGIEYGLMQAYGEGFDIMRNANSNALAEKHPLQPEPRRNRRTLASRQRRQFLLLDLTAIALAEIPNSPATPFRCRIPAKAAGQSSPPSKIGPAEVLTASLFVRFGPARSIRSPKRCFRMRKQFGGHTEKH